MGICSLPGRYSFSKFSWFSENEGGNNPIEDIPFFTEPWLWKEGYPPTERVLRHLPPKGNTFFFIFPDCKVCHLVVLFWNSSHVTISKHRWIPSGFPCFFFKRLVENMRFHRTANFLGSSFSEANLWSLRGFIVVFLLHLPSTQDASSWQIKANTDSRSLKCNVILLMEEILHQLIWQIISHYLQCKVLYIPGGAGFLPSTVSSYPVDEQASWVLYRGWTQGILFNEKISQVEKLSWEKQYIFSIWCTFF